MTHRRRRERGQAAVELVLVLPLLLLVALAALQVAVVARDQVLVVHAAREAARQAALGASDQAATAAAASATGLDPARLRVLTERADREGVVRVRVRFSSPTDVPLIGAMLAELDLSDMVEMRLER